MGDYFTATPTICTAAGTEVNRAHNGTVGQPSFFIVYVDGVAHPVLAALCGSNDGNFFVRKYGADYYVYYVPDEEEDSC